MQMTKMDWLYFHGSLFCLVLGWLRARARDSWFRQYATSWKVAGARPDKVIEFFQFT
jgi:hypothetical protein